MRQNLSINIEWVLQHGGWVLKRCRPRQEMSMHLFFPTFTLHRNIVLVHEVKVAGKISEEN